MKPTSYIVHFLWTFQVLASEPSPPQKLSDLITPIHLEHQHIHEIVTQEKAHRMASLISDKPIRAMIYRGKSATEECPESVARLLKSTFPNQVKITYAGPDEKVKINAHTLSHVDLFAQPGGPGT